MGSEASEGSEGEGEGDGDEPPSQSDQPAGDELVALQVSSASSHSCAIVDDGAGTVACWGKDNMGVIGQGEPSPEGHHFATPVPGISGAIEVGTAYQQSCALTDAGKVYCWGTGVFGELGDGQSGDNHFEAQPVEVIGAENIVDIDVERGAVCAVRNDGRVLCWGYNADGELGFESTPCGPYEQRSEDLAEDELECQEVAMEVPGLEQVAEVEVGGFHQCALLLDQRVACWGQGAQGQLGAPGDAPALGPARIVDLDQVEDLELGIYHSCARRSDGSVWCWGSDLSGQLGIGGESNKQTRPVEVVEAGATLDLAAAVSSTCAVKSSGEVACWGDIGFLFLNEDRPNPGLGAHPLPVTVPYLPPVAVQVSSEGRTSCMVDAAGLVRCWGFASDGATGNGLLEGFDTSAQPVRVAG